ncbi:MAG: methyltransferase domain-containing protein, partial [Salinibacterium sp.]|nr:methyltransferase domain-containing protein [Salinibacterium sp.]
FADDSFDVVFLSEVIEHLANPVRSVLELVRVAKHAVIITTEAFADTEEARRQELADRRLEPHMDRSILCEDDFRRLLAPLMITVSNQCSILPERCPDAGREIFDRLEKEISKTEVVWPSHGIVVIARREGVVEPRFDRPGSVLPVRDLLAPGPSSTQDLRPQSVPDRLMRRLRCPACGEAALEARGLAALRCGGCSSEFAVDSGVPKLLTRPGQPFPRSLEELVQLAAPEDAERQQQILELESLLRFDLPVPMTQRSFTGADLSEWESSGARVGVVDGACVLDASDEDPGLSSPRMLISMQDLEGFEVEVSCDESSRGAIEQMQVYLWTLCRPVWWELGSAIEHYAADGTSRRLRLAPPAHWADLPHDELLRLRLDPGHGRGCYRIRSFNVLTKAP